MKERERNISQLPPTTPQPDASWLGIELAAYIGALTWDWAHKVLELQSTDPPIWGSVISFIIYVAFI